MKKEMEVKLKTPVVIAGKNDKEDKVYNSFTLRPFKAKHLRYLSREILDIADMNEKEIEADPLIALQAMSKMIPLIAGLAEVDEEVVGQLEIADLMEVANELGPFLSELSGTGKNVSGQ